MARGPDPNKVKEWTKRLERFGKSNQTVVEFCRSERVSQPSFYRWKQTLAGVLKTPRPRRRSPTKASSGFKEVRLSPLEDSPDVTIRLPSGISIELGKDLSMIENVMAQLLDRQPTNGELRKAGGASC